jgi:hypothetical protein
MAAPRPGEVTAASLLLAANALVALAYGLTSDVPQELVAAVALGLVAWGVWRGSDIARVFVWLFTGLVLVSLALRIAAVVAGGSVQTGSMSVLIIAGDLATLVASVLVGRPAGRDFFLARRRQHRSARVEDLDD